MNIKIIAVGKQKASPELDLVNEYKKRINKWKLEIVEIDSKHNYSKDQEARMIMDKISSHSSFVIVLDEHGKNISSLELSKKIDWVQDEGCCELVFAIGGAMGHGDLIKKRADLLLSLGKMTWPHMLARVMIVEQIYRSQQISINHPYHK